MELHRQRRAIWPVSTAIGVQTSHVHNRIADSGAAQRRGEASKPLPMSFDPQFARDTVLPMVAAAYQVAETPGTTPVLPPRYHQTALVEADLDAVTAIADLPDSARSFVERVTEAGTVFGLMGNNPEPAVKTAFVAIRGTRTESEWLHNFNIATTA